MTDWRSTYSERFLRRAIQRPAPAPVYGRLTDEQIALLPEPIQPYLRMSRTLADAVRPVALSISRVAVPIPPGWELHHG